MNVSTVKSWSAEKGWGFLLNPEPGGPDIFVHHTGVLGHGRKDLEPGLQVTFSLEQTDKGLRAVNVSEVGQVALRPPSPRSARRSTSVLASLLLLFHFAFFILNCPAADSITITGYALFQNGTPVSRQTVNLTPVAPLPRVYYTNQYTPQAFSCQTSTNGFYGFTNVLWGYYTFTIPGNPGRSFPVTVGTNLSGVVNMSVVITNTATLPPNPSTNYYTQAQVDALIAGNSDAVTTNDTRNLAFTGASNFMANLNTASLKGYLFSGVGGIAGVLANGPNLSGGTEVGIAATDSNDEFANNIPIGQFYGTYSGMAALPGLSNNYVGSFTGNGSGLTNLPTSYDASLLTNLPFADNLQLTNTRARIRANKNLRIANYGDDAFSPYTGNIGPTIMGKYRLWNGTIGSSGGTYYSDFSASVTQTTFGSATIPFIVYGMPTSTGLTNRTAFPTDTVSLQYVRSNGFGTITVLTNDGSSGVWGIVGVVDANNSSIMDAAVTNFTVAAGTRKAAAWSTGTNLVMYCGNYHSGIATNFLWDTFQTGDIDLLTAATNTFWLNCATRWLSQYDAVLFNESSGSNQTILGYPGFYAAMRTNAPNTDVIFLQPPPDTNSLVNSSAARLAYGKLARDYGLPVKDVAGIIYQLSVSERRPLYTADGVHLSPAGNTLLTTPLVHQLANPFSEEVTKPMLPYLDSLSAGALTAATITNTALARAVVGTDANGKLQALTSGTTVLSTNTTAANGLNLTVNTTTGSLTGTNPAAAGNGFTLGPTNLTLTGNITNGTANIYSTGTNWAAKIRVGGAAETIAAIQAVGKITSSTALEAGSSGSSGSVTAVNSGGTATVQLAGAAGVLISRGQSFSVDDNATLSGNGNSGLFFGSTAATVGNGTFKTNLSVVGSITATNGYFLPTNAITAWPTVPRWHGEAFIGNSNGVVYLLTSVPGSLTWAATNKLAP